MALKAYYIICGKFFDGVHEELKENIKIIVEGNRIKEVGENLVKPSDAEVIDLSDLTVTPGMIDSHVHFEFMDFTFNEFAATDSDEMKALNLVHNCNESLMKGFTSIRTTGTAFMGFGAIDVKRAIEKGMFSASRLLVAPHALGIPGGHWDFSMFLSGGSYPELSDFMEQKNACGCGPDDFRRLVRKQVKYGADFIKIMACGGFASPKDDPGYAQLDEEEIEAIIHTAKILGVPVMAHAYTSDVIDMLIKHGVSEIEHGTLMQEHTAKLLEENQIPLVPTIYCTTGDPRIDPKTLPPRAPAYQRKLNKYKKQLDESRKIICKLIMEHKVPVGLGSDIVAGMKNTDSWCEFQAWRNMGIPALRTLVAGTSDNAKICGFKDLGEIAPGKIADIAAWHRDIINDYDALSECSFVMMEGKVYKQHK